MNDERYVDGHPIEVKDGVTLIWRDDWDSVMLSIPGEVSDEVVSIALLAYRLGEEAGERRGRHAGRTEITQGLRTLLGVPSFGVTDAIEKRLERMEGA